jgi:class 3 adenylate cyclase
VLIDRKTRASLDDSAQVDALGPTALDGFAAPVPVFRLTAIG